MSCHYDHELQVQVHHYNNKTDDCKICLLLRYLYVCTRVCVHFAPIYSLASFDFYVYFTGHSFIFVFFLLFLISLAFYPCSTCFLKVTHNLYCFLFFFFVVLCCAVFEGFKFFFYSLSGVLF